MAIQSLKFCVCVVLLLAVGTGVQAADSPGIRFFNGSWKEVLAEAKRQNKPIFIDVFTAWCGPCKVMAKQAFPDEKVGAVFNANFISYQIDAEKGEGIALAKQYAVNAYPTSLYVSPDGNLFYRSVGYSGVKAMLSEVDKAIAAMNDPNPLSVLESEYASGKHDPDFLITYLKKRASVEMPNAEALDAYLKLIPEVEWKSDQNLKIIAAHAMSYNPEIMDLLLGKLADLKGATDKEAISFRNEISGGVYRINLERKRQAIALKNEQLLNEFIKSNEVYLNTVNRRPLTSEQADDLATNYRLDFYLKTQNLSRYSALASERASKLMQLNPVDVAKRDEEAYQRFEAETRSLADSIKQTDSFKQYAAKMKHSESGAVATKLNTYAWAYYENSTDKKWLTQALGWSERAIVYDHSATFLRTKAHLLSKLGRKNDAIKTQQEAIAALKTGDGDVSSFEKELAEMKAK